MIDAITTKSTGLASPGKNGTADNAAAAGPFDAALAAARKAEERRKEHDSELDSIKSKGFSTWVRDQQIEELKKKLRQQVMADMGMDEQSLSQLSATMREILEQKIQEEVEKRMQEEMAKNDDSPGAQPKTAAAQPAGKNDQQGKTCPVIPSLAWPGGPSLF